MSQHFIESSFSKEDVSYELPLRPQTLAEFIGQEHVREQLEVLIGAAKKRKDVLAHCLFSGPPGLGKTSLSHIIANLMGTNITVTSGPVIEKAGDLAGILTNLKEGDILFIDEIHRLNATVEEYLYSAMEDFQLDIVIDQGVQARSVKVKLCRFTLIGATTRMGLLSAPLRSRFPFSCRLDYYSPELLQKILQRSSSILNITSDAHGLLEIAKRSRGTPRIANNLLRWVRDFAEMRANNIISQDVAKTALCMLSIDDQGLDEMDMRILRTIIDQYQGGPVGLQTIGVAVGEEEDTLEEVYEPYLIMQGFLQRTPRGRMATPHAYRHLGKQLPEKFQNKE
jgi:Holliday junction DNA helicase RuvB